MGEAGERRRTLKKEKSSVGGELKKRYDMYYYCTEGCSICIGTIYDIMCAIYYRKDYKIRIRRTYSYVCDSQSTHPAVGSL